MAPISESIRRKYVIILAIDSARKPTLADVVRVTGLPQSSVKRLMAKIRSDFEIDIQYIEEARNPGRVGYYRIVSWGASTPSEFRLRFGYLLNEPS